MSNLRADVLVTHEAPSPHPHRFAAIGELARSLRASKSFHGHHRDSRDYSSSWDALGVQARGVGFRGIMDLEGRVIRAGNYDDKARDAGVSGPLVRQLAGNDGSTQKNASNFLERNKGLVEMRLKAAVYER